MTTDQLKNLLSDMADEVKPTSVHQRAVAQSRRIAIRQAAVASVATLVLVGGGVVGADALADRPHDNDHAVDTALPTSDVDEIAGTYFQVAVEVQTPETLVSWRAGANKPTDLAGSEKDWGLYYRTGNIAPDGAHFSYLTPQAQDGGESATANRVMVLDMAEGDAREVAEYSSTAEPCSEPVWAPDGERLFVDRGPGTDGGRTGFVDIGTGEFTPFPVQNPCDLMVTTNADGEDVVLSTADDPEGPEVYATTADGKRTALDAAKVAKGESRYITELVAASPDGRFLCVETEIEPGNYHGQMKGRSASCGLLIDTATGRTIDIDERNGVLPAGGPSTFAVPGRLLMEGDDGTGEGTHELYDYRGRLIDETTSAMGDQSLPLAFVPD